MDKAEETKLNNDKSQDASEAGKPVNDKAAKAADAEAVKAAASDKKGKPAEKKSEGKSRRKPIKIKVIREDGGRNVVRIVAEVLLALMLAASFWIVVWDGLGLKETGTEWLTGGLPVLADRFADRITILTLKIQYGVAHEKSAINTVFTPLMMLFTVVLAWLAVRLKVPVILILFAAAGIAGVVSGIIPAGIWIILYFAVIAIIVIYRRYASSACLMHFKNAAVMTAGTVVLGVVIASMLTLAGVRGFLDIDSIKDDMERRAHQKKYEQYSNPMPEGRVSEAGSFNANDTPVLEVSESSWETTYLKGFVGEEYKDGSWVRARDEKTIDDADMFYWMHQEGFYGQSQLGYAYAVTGSEAADYVSVNNLRACRRFCYIPYGTLMGDESVLDKRDIGDLNITVEDPDDSTDYIFSVVRGAADSSRSLQKAIKGKDSGEDQETGKYLDKEETYRKYCRRRYLAVPDEIKGTLKECLGESRKMTPADAMAAILKYMNQNVHYSEKSAKAGDEDFVVKFLSDTKKGYAIHYASAAVMMLRYYGIPARYAEGYIVPDMLYGEAVPMAAVNVPEKYAHAWAEYYLDGVGWLPFETVPKYQQSGSEGVSPDKNAGRENQEDKKKDDKKNTDNPLNRVGKIFVMNVPLIIAMCVAVLLFIIWIIIMRRRRLKRFISTFYGQDMNTAVKNAFAYAVAMLKASGTALNNTMLRESVAKSGLDDDRKQLMTRCIDINEAVRYGGRNVDEKQRNEVLKMKETALKIYREKRSLTGKAWDRLVRCIY